MSAERDALLVRALRLSGTSIAVGALVGGLSVAVGLAEGSVGVLGSGLGLLADLVGSVGLVLRFAAERRSAGAAVQAEHRAAVVVAAALFVVGVVICADAVQALLAHARPSTSVLSLLSAAITVVALPPLALAKRRTAAALGSAALRGDASISLIGAGTGLIALLGLVLFRAFGWWWSDRVAALFVAGLALLESRRLRGELRDARAEAG